MKKITNTYTRKGQYEPMVIWLIPPRGIAVSNDRVHRNLLPKGEITIEDYQVSPEMERMRHKGYISIEDIPDKSSPESEALPVVEAPPPEEPKPDRTESKKKEPDEPLPGDEEGDIEELERKLLEEN